VPAISLPRIPEWLGFDSKISLFEREKNTFYAENKRRKVGFERITNQRLNT